MKKHYEWKIGQKPPALGPHSKAKHDIIAAYVRRYIEICTSTPVQEKLNLTIVDGFCGGGRYSYMNEIVSGSPLILLKAVSEMREVLSRSRARGFNLQVDFIFIDSEKNHTDYLMSEISSSEFADQIGKSIFIWNDRFEDRAQDAVVHARKRSPQRGRSLFLLDQYGWNSVTFSEIRNILSNLEKAEIFLTFSVDALIDYMTEKTTSTDMYSRIGLDKVLVSELLRIKDEQRGWRTIIQNTLYSRLIMETGAKFYSPFFIRSADAHRTYWFVHISRHREARNEMGNIHWKYGNYSVHHGGAGLNALGFSGTRNHEQMVFGYDFDEIARDNSENVLLSQIPQLIDASKGTDFAPTLEELFGRRCNDTPVTRNLFEQVLLKLRDESELRIEDALGAHKPRATKINWTDRIVLSQQPSFFGPFGRLQKPDG